MSEEKEIMDFFGYGQIEGDVRGEHFAKILTFLKTYDGQTWDFIKDVSPLVIHMQFRYIKENYISGLLRLGIIKVYSEGNIYKYRWIGIKALNGRKIMPFTDAEKEMEKITEKETEKENKKGYCPNCGKKLKKGKKFCNEKCLTEYMKKKKEKK